ncbi:hypothetical protein NMG60_11008321 [Bertholletia excelsa]
MGDRLLRLVGFGPCCNKTRIIGLGLDKMRTASYLPSPPSLPNGGHSSALPMFIVDKTHSIFVQPSAVLFRTPSSVFPSTTISSLVPPRSRPTSLSLHSLPPPWVGIGVVGWILHFSPTLERDGMQSCIQMCIGNGGGMVVELEMEVLAETEGSLATEAERAKPMMRN